MRLTLTVATALPVFVFGGAFAGTTTRPTSHSPFLLRPDLVADALGGL